MAYFPDNLMPLTPKSDAPGSGGDARILADAYNLHDIELRSIEEYLGFGVVGGQSRPYRSPQGGGKSVFQRLSELTQKINRLSLSGLSSTTGVCSSLPAPDQDAPGPMSGLSAQKMIAPSNIPTAFLSESLTATDGVVNVISTTGFPDSGVLTIVADIDCGSEVPTVEYIRYAAKSENSFTGCRRGWLGTIPVSVSVDDQAVADNNAHDDCLLAQFQAVGNNGGIPGQTVAKSVCKNRWPALDSNLLVTRDILTLPVGLSGTRPDLVLGLMSEPSKYPLEPDSVDMDALRTIADGLGILQVVAGANVLVSADATARTYGRLTGLEASSFVEAAIAAGKTTTTTVDTLVVGKDPQPVFCGQMSIQYSLAYIYSSAFGYRVSQQGFRIGATGPGANAGAACYHLFGIPSPRSDSEAS